MSRSREGMCRSAKPAGQCIGARSWSVMIRMRFGRSGRSGMSIGFHWDSVGWGRRTRLAPKTTAKIIVETPNDAAIETHGSSKAVPKR